MAETRIIAEESSAAASAAPATSSASGRATAVQTPTDTTAWWQQHDQRVYQCITLWVEQWFPPVREALFDAVGKALGEYHAAIDETLTNLKERVIRLETTSSFEERFTKLAYEVKRGPELPQSELLARIEALQRQVDELKKVADLDAGLRELAERVGELEKTNSLEARFTKLANEAKGGAEIQQSELLARISGLQRRVDEVSGVAGLDAGFRQLAERVGELEKTSSLEACFTRLASEFKQGSEIPPSELLARIDGLQRQLDELKSGAAQPGPQGPPGPPGKLPCVKDYVAGRVHYETDVVTHDGALWQAKKDTAQAPGGADWICVARAGRDGVDAPTLNVRGTYDARETYWHLDVVALDGASFVAKRDDPGICTGDGWQLLCRQGKRGQRGERGPAGPKGDKGEPIMPALVNAKVDEHYNLVVLRADKSLEIIPLREAFERYDEETRP